MVEYLEFDSKRLLEVLGNILLFLVKGITGLIFAAIEGITFLFTILSSFILSTLICSELDLRTIICNEDHLAATVILIAIPILRLILPLTFKIMYINENNRL